MSLWKALVTLCRLLVKEPHCASKEQGAKGCFHRWPQGTQDVSSRRQKNYLCPESTLGAAAEDA